jgi:hypothetical protein
MEHTPKLGPIHWLIAVCLFSLLICWTLIHAVSYFKPNVQATELYGFYLPFEYASYLFAPLTAIVAKILHGLLFNRFVESKYGRFMHLIVFLLSGAYVLYCFSQGRGIVRFENGVWWAYGRLGGRVLTDQEAAHAMWLIVRMFSAIGIGLSLDSCHDVIRGWPSWPPTADPTRSTIADSRGSTDDPESVAASPNRWWNKVDPRTIPTRNLWLGIFLAPLLGAGMIAVPIMLGPRDVESWLISGVFGLFFWWVSWTNAAAHFHELRRRGMSLPPFVVQAIRLGIVTAILLLFLTTLLLLLVARP